MPNLNDRQTVTVGFIAQTLGVSKDRVKNILRSRPHITARAIGWASSTRIYEKAVIAMVRYELNKIDARHDAAKAE